MSWSACGHTQQVQPGENVEISPAARHAFGDTPGISSKGRVDRICGCR